MLLPEESSRQATRNVPVIKKKKYIVRQITLLWRKKYKNLVGNRFNKEMGR